MVKKLELERETITGLTILCIEQGLDRTGDKETLIARLLGKGKPEPEAEPSVEPGESGEPGEGTGEGGEGTGKPGED